MDNAIEVSHLVVRRGRRTVLPDFSATMGRGRITGLLGPSGSGKTTLMRAIVGVQVTHGGSVTVLGSPAGSPSLRRRVGYVTQAASVYRDLTVRQNVTHFATLVGASRSRVAEVIDLVGLGEAAHQLGSTLSGGQLSRASLACALVGDPELLVLDEPTVGQDPVLRDELWRQLRERAAAGTTILISSHVMDEAARCDDVLLLRDGRLLTANTPAALLERTGAPNLDDAFLALIKDTEVAA